MGITIPTVIHIGVAISFEGSDALQEYALECPHEQDSMSRARMHQRNRHRNSPRNMQGNNRINGNTTGSEEAKGMAIGISRRN